MYIPPAPVSRRSTSCWNRTLEESVSLGCHSNRVSHSAAVSLVTLTPTVCSSVFFFPPHPTVPLPSRHQRTYTETHFSSSSNSKNSPDKEKMSLNVSVVTSILIYLKLWSKKATLSFVLWCAWLIAQADDEGERNVAAYSLIIYLWIWLISKPTAEKHTVKEAGGVRKRKGAPNTHFSPRTLVISDWIKMIFGKEIFIFFVWYPLPEIISCFPIKGLCKFTAASLNINTTPLL